MDSPREKLCLSYVSFNVSFYNQVWTHQYSGGLTPNKSERIINNEYKSVASFT